MKRWLKRIAIGLVLASIGAYAADWVVFTLRGQPTSTVTVTRYQTVPLKGNKIEYDYLGTGDVSCAVALFPQAGQSPCWYLRRNPNQTINL